MNEDGKSRLSLPASASDFISDVVNSVRYSRKVRQEVRSELEAHFLEALSHCSSDQEKEKTAKELIDEFGDPKVLAVLIRRGKKRCRSVWKKVLSTASYSVAVLFVMFIIYIVWFINGKPNPKINYLAMLNEAAKPAVLDGDNAWNFYDKAIQLYVEPDEHVNEIISSSNNDKSGDSKFTKLSNDDKLKLREWIDSNSESWNQYSLASERQYCFRRYASGGDETGMLINVLLPHLSNLRAIARDLGLWRMRIAVADGNIDRAVDDCIVLLRVGKHWQGKGTLIEQLVGMAINNQGLRHILELVDSGLLSKEKLLDVKERVEAIYTEGNRQLDISVEKMFFLDTVQYSFTDGGPGGGHLIPKNIAPLMDVSGSGEDYEHPWSVVGIGMLHAGRDETVKIGLELYDFLESLGELTPYQRKQKETTQEKKNSELSHIRHRFLLTFMPALGRCFAMNYEKNTYQQALLTILAIEIYKYEQGGYPAGLEKLIDQGYLDSIPDDPYSAGTLVYRQIDEGYTIYSLGRNFVDDGGEPFFDKKGEYRLWKGDQGDAVFWPLN